MLLISINQAWWRQIVNTDLKTHILHTCMSHCKHYTQPISVLKMAAIYFKKIIHTKHSQRGPNRYLFITWGFAINTFSSLAFCVLYVWKACFFSLRCRRAPYRGSLTINFIACSQEAFEGTCWKKKNHYINGWRSGILEMRWITEQIIHHYHYHYNTSR